MRVRPLITDLLQTPEGTVAIRRSIQGMLEELEPNLWEHCLSRLVDYGHTFSPEIEMAALALGSNEMLLHGEAVNIDMVSRLDASPALHVPALPATNCTQAGSPSCPRLHLRQHLHHPSPAQLGLVLCQQCGTSRQPVVVLSV